VGLRHRLLSVATSRPRCHLVEAPGGADVRRAVEDALDGRGWSPAPGPASADALVVAGRLPEELEEAADLLWAQLPGPRARCVVPAPADVGRALEAVRGGLRDDREQRADARDRGTDAVTTVLAASGEHHAGGHGEDHDEHGGHHDHGSMDMAPGGIALAEGAEDRDGLEMDVLVHPLGPLLDHWPGGLELRVTLHGDVVAEAEARWWGTAGPGRRPTFVDGWDAVATTLALAGDARGARLARRLRGGRRQGGDRLRRHVRRLGRASVLPGAVAGTLLDLVGPDPGARAAEVDPAALVEGHDLADARLLVAAHRPLLGAGAVRGTGDD
jgi:hypothetical protein